ncbi:MAG: HlyC/CorC family transporter [Lewinellaceae bacterium]|nr:HlyC/CorC family transporter [Lewinellaceae bacterium]
MMWMLLLLALLFSALFSGVEIAYVSANKLRVELKKQQGGRRGALITRFYANPSRFLGAMLVGNNIVLVIFTMLLASLLNPILSSFIPSELWLSLVITVIGTLIVLVFGEFLPKVLFRNYAEKAIYNLAFPIQFMNILLAVPASMMTGLSHLMLRLVMKRPPEVEDAAFSRLELESYIRDSQTYSETRIDTDLFGKALHLKQVRVKDCMVPRTEIESVDVSDNLEELKNLFMETKLSRLLVVDGDIDNVLGYVHHQQMLTSKGPIRKMIFQIPFVPESMKVQDLLNLLIKENTSIACVVDEYGGTAGIITMEDILEEIFGEIEDEHDEEEYVEEQVSRDEYRFSGRLEIDYLNEKYPYLQFPKGEYHTLSGYLVMTTTSIPEEGDELILDGYKFILEVVSDKKIETVRVIRYDAADEDVVL